MAPLGLPVVPLVYWITARSPTTGRWEPSASGPSASRSDHARVPGAGLVIASRAVGFERQLREQQTNRRELGRDAFLERVWAWKAESGGTITRQPVVEA